MTACSSGTSKGIAALTGDEQGTLLSSSVFQRYRLRQIAHVVGAQWSKNKPVVADPFAGEPEESRAEALSHQLCEWIKGGKKATLNKPKTILAGEL